MDVNASVDEEGTGRAAGSAEAEREDADKIAEELKGLSIEDGLEGDGEAERRREKGGAAGGRGSDDEVCWAWGRFLCLRCHRADPRVLLFQRVVGGVCLTGRGLDSIGPVTCPGAVVGAWVVVSRIGPP